MLILQCESQQYNNLTFYFQSSCSNTAQSSDSQSILNTSSVSTSSSSSCSSVQSSVCLIIYLENVST